MADVEDRLTTTEKRLHNQEKRLRYHRITVGILVLFIMLLVGTRVGANSGVLTCTKLRVVDAEGNVQVALSATTNGGFVATGTPEGEPLVVLGPDTGGNGGVWTTTKSGRKKRLD